MTYRARHGFGPKLCLLVAAGTLAGVVSSEGGDQESRRPAGRFEVAAWVDHFDFYRAFDTEKAAGVAAILDHVQETGATTILWRNCGGGTMRYQSEVDSHHHSSQLDKRRVLDTRSIAGWVRYGEAEPDLIATVVKLCQERGLRPGIHWPYEETHWSCWTIGRFNLEHPQYWGRTILGRPWWGRCSIAFEPVIEHKLALVDELLERGIEMLFIDFWRNGGWSPAYEYVEPVMASFRAKHGSEPPSNWRDLRWAEHVAGYVTAFLRRVRRRLSDSGRKVELAVGVPEIAPFTERNLTVHGADWRTWVREGLVDTLVINYVKWDQEDALGSTRELCRQVMNAVDGRCRVLWPIQQYNYSRHGLPAYEKATEMKNEHLARALLLMAWEEGAAGVSLECVDYGNYRQKTRSTLRALATGKCRLLRPSSVVER